MRWGSREGATKKVFQAGGWIFPFFFPPLAGSIGLKVGLNRLYGEAFGESCRELCVFWYFYLTVRGRGEGVEVQFEESWGNVQCFGTEATRTSGYETEPKLVEER